jgi:imidazolonepropionase-like amidohydrolase
MNFKSLVVTIATAQVACWAALWAAAPATLLADPYPSTYQPLPSVPTLIVNATILTGTGERIDNGSLLLAGGRIEKIGDGSRPVRGEDAVVIDAAGRWVTPGLIDVHSHLGVYASPYVKAHSDGNEMTSPVTAQVWAEHSVWPQDPGFGRALAGGVTTLQVLPGSANLIGGRGVTLKNVPSVSYQGMKFPGAPYGLKMACGENPKRVYGERMQTPSTRMGNVAGYRAEWIAAQKYIQDWDRYAAELAGQANGKKAGDGDGEPEPPVRDLKLETLAGALKGEILVHMHCYRADEMLTMLDMAEEFGYRVSAFHHGVEAYKVAGELAERGVCGALWSDWWGFKAEAYDGIQENIALVDRPTGGCAIVHSDSAEGIQRLNQDAAKAMMRGQRAGMDIPPKRAIRWITANAARSLGILEQTGTLEPGKMADVVIWNGNPFSVYAQADQVFIDGARVFDRNDPARQPVSDFELGQQAGQQAGWQPGVRQ